MNVTCDKCNKRYSIADEKVRGKAVKIRCKQCQNLISVQGPVSSGGTQAVSAAAEVRVTAAAPVQQQWEDERTRAVPAMDLTAQWFAMVKGKQLGPFDLKGLEGKVKSGELTLRTYLWKQGMGDWKRASDVPEVSSVFAGVSVGATATGPASSAASERPSSKRVASVQRDVAMGLETASPEITSKKSNGNGNGNGHGHAASSLASPMQDPAGRAAKLPSQARAAVAAPAPTPVPVAAPEPVPAKSAEPLNDLFGDADHSPQPEPGADARSTMDGDSGGEEQAGEGKSGPTDPFAALGEADPSQVPAIGEATKFFIAQSGVNKRNPPWKIALFVLGGPGLIVGALWILSTLHIVPLEVTRTNDQGEEVKESFFSANGVSGLKDMLSGEAKKKKAEAEAARLAAAAAAEAKKKALAAANPTPTVDSPEKPTPPKPIDATLALVYGNKNPTEPVRAGPRVRIEDRPNQKVTDGAGLTAEASQKVIAEKIKGFEGCIENALRRNPNLAVGNIEVVVNVGGSGAVTSANIAPARHDNTDWGGCMREVAKRIVFPRSDGETELRIPLKVGIALQ